MILEKLIASNTWYQISRFVLIIYCIMFLRKKI